MKRLHVDVGEEEERLLDSWVSQTVDPHLDPLFHVAGRFDDEQNQGSIRQSCFLDVPLTSEAMREVLLTMTRAGPESFASSLPAVARVLLSLSRMEDWMFSRTGAQGGNRHWIEDTLSISWGLSSWHNILTYKNHLFT